MALNADAAIALYILISSVLSLVINIIFFRFVFKKKKRLKANTFTWLTTLGMMIPVSFALMAIFLSIDVSSSSVGGALGYGLLMTLAIPPIFWFVPTTLYSLIRAIFIAITRRKEREILEEDIQDVGLNVEPILAQKHE